MHFIGERKRREEEATIEGRKQNTSRRKQVDKEREREREEFKDHFLIFNQVVKERLLQAKRSNQLPKDDTT